MELPITHVIDHEVEIQCKRCMRLDHSTPTSNPSLKSGLDSWDLRDDRLMSDEQ